jgi:Promethin
MPSPSKSRALNLKISRKLTQLQTFLLTQLLLSFTPLALFLSFVLGLLLLSFITALLFSLFWIGVALLVLVPSLFITVSLGIVVWIWGVGSFAVARWVYGFVPARGGKDEVLERSNGGVKREGEGRNSNGA